MQFRLSLEERNSIAFKLRTFTLQIENPGLLETLHDPDYQPHDTAVPIYAFEFFLDRFRNAFRTAVKDNVEYICGWVQGASERDEQPPTPDRLIRMSTVVFMQVSTDEEVIKGETDIWYRSLHRHGIHFDREQLEMFMYEVYCELGYEYARELFRQQN